MTKKLTIIFTGVALISGLHWSVTASAVKRSITSSHITAVQMNSVVKVVQVDINLAGISDLVQLKGIGKKIAQRIIRYRQQHGLFKSVSDLVQVPGISAKRLARWQKNNADKVRLIVKK